MSNRSAAMKGKPIGSSNPRNYIDAADAPKVRGVTRRLPPSKIKPNTWNYNTEPEEMFGKLVRTIRKRGFIDRPVVRKIGPDQWEYINGEHRHLAAEALAMPEVEVIDLGEVSDEEAKQLCIEGNEFKGRPDEVRLADLLRDINTTVPFEDIAATMPFSDKELRVYIDSVDFSFANLPTIDTREPVSDEDAGGDADDDSVPPGGGGPRGDGDSADPTSKFDRLILTYPVGEAKELRRMLREIDADPATAVRAAVEAYLKKLRKKKPAADAEPSSKESP